MAINIHEAPRDPIELSIIRAEDVPLQAFDHTVTDERLLAELDFAARELELHGKRYYIESNRAFLLPVESDAGTKLTYTEFYGLTFEGEFSTYSRISIGRLLGSPHTVRALCIAVGSALLLPYFDNIPEDSLLHVPVLAVNHIQLAA